MTGNTEDEFLLDLFILSLDYGSLRLVVLVFVFYFKLKCENISQY